ncbi:MAG TPA: methyltransferase domain-containing protein [Gammaproteobacteria bacterium]|nr:methyltransferase domain-containing protein [Gammaproteobacteria bacterium]
MSNKHLERFKNLTYEDFRRMAKDPTLSVHEKIGCPDSYRASKENAILEDITAKLEPLRLTGKTILDIGIGCGALTPKIIEYCASRKHRLIAIDSKEVLECIPDRDFIEKIDAYYPDCPSLFERYSGKIDCIISYSVFHYIFVESNVWRFLDKSLQLLAPGGTMLIGDIPNISKRRRFFSSDTGVRFHREFTGTGSNPEVTFNTLLPDGIDDSVVIALLERARNAGFDAYIVPQASDLPMANRREDLIFIRP